MRKILALLLSVVLLEGNEGAASEGTVPVPVRGPGCIRKPD